MSRPHSLHWGFASFLVAALCLTPIMVVVVSLLHPDIAVWQHIAAYVLPDLLVNTSILLAGVSALTLLLGVGLAWLVSTCEFPGRKNFAWMLALPLALPAYVAAFADLGMLDYTGTLQTWLRASLGWQGSLPALRSRWGVIVVLSLAFYPYVYLLARQAFVTQGRRAVEVAQSLGYSPWKGFWQVALPSARPWIAGGLLLVWMETLADFGTVSVFNFDTFTTAIYKSWFALFSMPAAAQLSALLVILVLVLAAGEAWARRRQKYTATAQTATGLYPLRGWRAGAAVLAATLTLAFAFVLPVVQLLIWASQSLDSIDARYYDFVSNSLRLALGCAVLSCLCALILARAARLYPSLKMQVLVKLSTLGYAIPGSVLAVGIFIPVAWLDNQLIALAKSWDVSLQLFLRGSVAVMILALTVRFLAVAYHPVEAAMQRISRSHEDAAQILGLAGWRLFRQLHWGMLKGGLFTAALMVFVDVMKEIPITLMLRPFGWETLSVRIFEMTSEGMWENAALPALALLVVGLLPVIILGRQHH